jgi:hypothetical protein
MNTLIYFFTLLVPYAISTITTVDQASTTQNLPESYCYSSSSFVTAATIQFEFENIYYHEIHGEIAI